MSNWSVSKVYLYLLALITFSVLLYNFVSLTSSIPDYISPLHGWVMDYGSARNELFMRTHGTWLDPANPEHAKKLAAITDEEIKEFMDKRQQEAIQQNRAMNLRNILRHGISFMVLLPVHLYFFRLARKS